MLRPRIDVLSTDVIKKIYTEAVAVLDNPGVHIDNNEARLLIEQAGGSVDRESRTARIPEELINKSLETAPANFSLYDLSGNPVVFYGEDRIHFDPGSTAIFILDNQTGVHREPVTKDFINFIKVVENLPQLDAQSTAFVCSDVPEEIGDWYRLYLALNYMKKPIITGAFGKETWWIMKEMLVVATGGEQELRARPIAVFDVCPSPPLLWSDLTCQNLIDCARCNIPAQIVSMPLAGATAPVTLAAAVVQHAAECLSGIVIHQLANPGAPIIWGGSPSVFDMRKGTTPMGAAGTWLIDAAYVQLGKYLNLPTHVYMGMSDAKINDAQCGLESMGGALVAALVGANMISGAGMLDFESCQSLEKLVIDAEIIGLAKRTAAGIELRDDPIGLELIQDMGHNARYLSLSHTRKWFREEQFLPSDVIDRGSYDAWVEEGLKTINDRASDSVNQLIDTYETPSISSEVKTELQSIANREAKKIGMDSILTFQ